MNTTDMGTGTACLNKQGPSQVQSTRIRTWWTIVLTTHYSIRPPNLQGIKDKYIPSPLAIHCCKLSTPLPSYHYIWLPHLTMVSAATAQAIVKATTFDIFNSASVPSRHELMEQYWSPNIVAHPPVGDTGTGFSTIDKMYDELHAEGRESWTFTNEGGLWINGDVSTLCPVWTVSVFARSEVE